MTQEYIITEETLYNKIYLHGYNHKAWETIDPAVLSHPYNSQAEQVGTDGLTDLEYSYQKAVEDIEILHDRLQKSGRGCWMSGQHKFTSAITTTV